MKKKVQENSLNLNGKMNDWGPYGENEGKWLIFSIGNPEEGHGYAIPRITDDLVGQRIAHLVACRTGARYIAHIPWATDSYYSVAIDWAPKIIPIKNLVEKIKKYLKYHIKIFKDMELLAENVLIISGHGGNRPIEQYTEEIKDFLKIKKLIISNVTEIFMHRDKISKAIKRITLNQGGDQKEIENLITKMLYSAGHASHLEHSLCVALGVLDWDKLKVMNDELEKDFEGSLKKWPPIGGLGGYLLHGGKYTEALGKENTNKHNLWTCLKGLQEIDGGKIKPIKEVGQMLINLLVDLFSELILIE